MIELRSQIDIELHVKRVEKMGSLMVKEIPLSDLDSFKIEVFTELKKAKYKDHEDIVCRMELTYHEVFTY